MNTKLNSPKSTKLYSFTRKKVKYNSNRNSKRNRITTTKLTKLKGGSNNLDLNEATLAIAQKKAAKLAKKAAKAAKKKAFEDKLIEDFESSIEDPNTPSLFRIILEYTKTFIKLPKLFLLHLKWIIVHTPEYISYNKSGQKLPKNISSSTLHKLFKLLKKNPSNIKKIIVVARDYIETITDTNIKKIFEPFLSVEVTEFIESNLKNVIILYLNFLKRFFTTHKLQIDKLKTLETICVNKDVDYVIDLLKLDKDKFNYFVEDDQDNSEPDIQVDPNLFTGGGKDSNYTKNNLQNDEYIRKELNKIITENEDLIRGLIKVILDIYCIGIQSYSLQTSQTLGNDKTSNTLSPQNTPQQTTPQQTTLQQTTPPKTPNQTYSTNPQSSITITFNPGETGLAGVPVVHSSSGVSGSVSTVPSVPTIGSLPGTQPAPAPAPQAPQAPVPQAPAPAPAPAPQAPVPSTTQAPKANAVQESKAKAKAVKEAKAKAVKEAQEQKEAQAKVDQEAKLAKADKEAQAQAEKEAKVKAVKEAQEQKEAQAKAEQEAQAKTAQEAQAKAEQEAQAKIAQEEQKLEAERLKTLQAEQEAQALAPAQQTQAPISQTQLVNQTPTQEQQPLNQAPVPEQQTQEPILTLEEAKNVANVANVVVGGSRNSKTFKSKKTHYKKSRKNIHKNSKNNKHKKTKKNKHKTIKHTKNSKKK